MYQTFDDTYKIRKFQNVDSCCQNIAPIVKMKCHKVNRFEFLSIIRRINDEGLDFTKFDPKNALCVIGSRRLTNPHWRKFMIVCNKLHPDILIRDIQILWYNALNKPNFNLLVCVFVRKIYVIDLGHFCAKWNRSSRFCCSEVTQNTLPL